MSKNPDEISGYERAWLQYIVDVAYDRDGCTTIKDLGELVDDIRYFAMSALQGKPAPFPDAAVSIKLERKTT